MVVDRIPWVYSLWLAMTLVWCLNSPVGAQAPTAEVVSIASVTPTSFGAGAELSVTGTGFQAGDVVRLGATSLEVVEVRPERLMLRVPAQQKRGGGLSVLRNRKQVASFAGLSFVPAPVLASAAPRYAKVGDSVTLRGRNLAAVVELRVGDAVVPVATTTSTAISFIVPAGLQTGSVTVTGIGGSANLRNSYEIYYPPVIESVQPARVAAGMAIEIRGKSFAEGDRIAIGSTVMQRAAIEPTRIKATLPARLLRGGPISITRRGKPVVRFAEVEWVPAPKLSAAAPSYASPGSVVTLRGTGLAAIDSVSIGESTLPIETRTAQSLTVKVPEGTLSGVVTVKSLGGEASLKKPYEIYYSPAIDEVQPKRFVPGSTLRVTGRHLAAIDTARLGSATLKITARSGEALELSVPAKLRKGGRLQLSQRGRSSITVDDLALVDEPIVAPVVHAVRYAPDAKGGATGTLRGEGFGPDTAFEFDGTSIEAKIIDATQASFRLSKLPGSGKHRVVGVTAGARGSAYELDGDAGGYRFRAAEVLKLLADKPPKYALDEVHLDLEQSGVVFADAAGSGVAALASVAAQSASRKEVGHALTGLSTELARLVTAQRALCGAMKAGKSAAQDNAYAGTLLARASKQAEHLLTKGLRPLWSGLPPEALTDKKRASELGLASVDEQLDAVIAARDRLSAECADRYHASADGKLVARAWETVDTGLQRQYESLVEQTFTRIRGASKDGAASEQSAQSALANAFPASRRAYWEQRLAGVLAGEKSDAKPTGKGAVSTKRAEKAGKK